MDSSNRTAKLAGALYLVTIVTGLFSLMYVPSRINVHGDAAATANNILASESLFRSGIAAGSTGYVTFSLLALALYKLLGPVNRNAAVLMVAFAMIQLPIYFVAVANQLDALSLLSGEIYPSAFTSDQLHAQVMLSLDAWYHRFVVSEIFCGLWLLPFGYLVFKSGFLPRILGVLLMMGCLSYLISFFSETLFPHCDIPGLVMLPATGGEIGICLWLLVIGVREPVKPVTQRHDLVKT